MAVVALQKVTGQASQGAAQQGAGTRPDDQAVIARNPIRAARPMAFVRAVMLESSTVRRGCYSWGAASPSLTTAAAAPGSGVSW